MPIHDEFAVLIKEHIGDDTPIGVLTAINGKIQLRTDDKAMFDWISGVCSDEYDAWDDYLKTGYPISVLFKSGYTPLLRLGDPNDAADRKILDKAIKDLGAVKYDSVIYEAKS